ncbi:MAG TPA: UbiA family prenyltransferase [Pirellulales bacterium]|nr:UbiA family prenyltransferase [Pirellulales bacterium]
MEIANEPPPLSAASRTRVARGAQLAWRPLVSLLRPHQWTKNLLLLVPAVLAHDLSPTTLATALLAMACFSACASAVYVVNDWLDVSFDRTHPHKRHRPFAAGTLDPALAPPIAALLASLGFGLAGLALPWTFSASLAIYVGASLAYTLWLKREAMADVLVLAGLYTTRLIAGSLATGVPLSEWLLAFSMFLFLSLALAKRHAELTRLAAEDAGSAQGRGYLVSDRALVGTLGPAAGYLTVLVLALYLNGDKVRGLYAHHLLLWLMCPLLLYWISRLWLLANRGELNEDPVVFAITDRTSLIVAALAAVDFGFSVLDFGW